VKKKPEKLWVVYTCELKYDVCGLGTTEEEAQRAVWDKVKSTNNSGAGLPADVTSMETFFDYYASRSYQLAPGEAASE
jgi:hypothetical protein